MRAQPPTPTSISSQAQAFLDALPATGAQSWPAADDLAGWDAVVARMESFMAGFYQARLPSTDRLTREDRLIAGVPTWVLAPVDVESDAIFIDLHGGGLYLGGGELAWKSAAGSALRRPGVTWSPDYRMPPRHPYPAALDDCVALYRAALEAVGAANVVVGGASAGGNLAAALLVRARDEGLPMPAGLVLLTPEVDLTESGDTFVTNHGVDFLAPLAAVNALYAAGEDLAHPYLSPLFADLAGLPPTFLQSGTRDLFLSNTVRMHRALRNAGVEAELHVWEAMPHGGFDGATPEDRELAKEIRGFERRVLGLS